MSKNLNNEKKAIEIFNSLSKLYVYLEEKGLQTKNASFNMNRINYCTGKDLAIMIQHNFDYIAGEIYKVLNIDLNTYSNSALQKIYEIFLGSGMMIKMDRDDEGKRLKYPKKLKVVPIQDLNTWEENKFYVLRFERPYKTKAYVYLSIIISVILVVCLFPVWPLSVKLGIWWVLFGLTLFLSSFIFLRIIVFFIAYLFGYDVWILPNLLDDKMSFIEGLSPIIAYYPREDSKFEVFLRIIFSLTIVLIAYLLYNYPNIVYDLYDLMKYCYDSVLEWGNTKITDLHNNTGALSKMNKHKELNFDD